MKLVTFDDGRVGYLDGEEIVELATASTREYFERGEAARNAGRYREAILAYQRAFALAPHPFALYNIALSYEKLGEWANARPIMIQFQNIQGSGLDQYLTGHKQVIVHPPAYKDGELEYPFAK